MRIRCGSNRSDLSEEWRRFKMKQAFLFRVIERQSRTVQHESIRQGWIAVESISENRMRKPLSMGRMHPQLMGASRERRKTHTRTICLAGQNLLVRDPEFAVHRVEDLSGAVVEIHPEGEFDVALVGDDDAFHQRRVGLAHAAMLKLPRQMPMR